MSLTKDGLVITGGITIDGPSRQWADITGLRLDLNPALGVWKDTPKTIPATADGDVVLRWVDQSSHAYVALAAGTGPILKLGANGMNSKPVLRMNSATPTLGAMYVPFGATLTQPSTVFYVERIETSQTRPMLDGIDGSNRNCLSVNAGNWDMYAGLDAVFSAWDINAHILTMVWNNASSKFAVDGAALATGNTSNLGVAGYSMGGDYTVAAGGGGGGDYQDQSVARLLVYDGVLPQTDIDIVRAYLRGLYNTY